MDVICLFQIHSNNRHVRTYLQDSGCKVGDKDKGERKLASTISLTSVATYEHSANMFNNILTNINFSLS